jgi:hypothetical protein
LPSGWFELLRSVVNAAQDLSQINQKSLLWLYIPDYQNNGTLTSIESIPGIIPLCDNNCSVQRQFIIDGILQNFSIPIPVSPP